MRTGLTLVAIGVLALVLRVAALPGSTEANMDADAPHFLNIARCISRGQGFANPAAWPAWIQPARLPMPETFKEPGYPYSIAALTPVVGDPFRAGQLLSLAAGLLIPFLVYALARALDPDRLVATVAGLVAAANPLLIQQSVVVMAESLLTAVTTALFVVAIRHPGDGPAARDASSSRLGLGRAAIAGALLGAAFLLRAQSLLLLLPLVWILFVGRAWRYAARELAVVLGMALLVASPLLVRNLRTFGVPFYSDVAAYGLWPYVDRIAFSHGLARPPSPLAFALAHPAAIAHQMRTSLVQFGTSTLPEFLLGNPVWTVPLAAGIALGLARWKRWGFAFVYVGVTVLFIAAVYWAPRYFMTTVPFWCVWTAMGAAWIARLLGPAPLLGRLRGAHLLVAGLAVTLGLQGEVTRRRIAKPPPPELEAARHEAPFLRAHLAPDEAVMAVTTSYWAWDSDRPTVHWVVASEPEFMAVVRRYKVRYAALPTSRLNEFVAHYPERRLPRALVIDHQDRLRDVTVFRVTSG